MLFKRLKILCSFYKAFIIHSQLFIVNLTHHVCFIELRDVSCCKFNLLNKSNSQINHWEILKRVAHEQRRSITYVCRAWAARAHSNRVWLQTCTCTTCPLMTLGLPWVTSLAVFFILFYLLILFLNPSKVYNSSQPGCEDKKKKTKLLCQLQSPLALSATCDVTCIRHESCALSTETRLWLNE